jgi:hypothetical protein
MSAAARAPGALAGDLAAVWGVLLQPGATFARLRERHPVLAPWLVASLLSVALALLTLSVSQRAAVHRMADLDSPDLARNVQESLGRAGLFSVALAPAALALRWAAAALILWSAVVLAGGGVSYRSVLCVVAYSAVPAILGQGVDLGVTWFQGPEFTPGLTPVFSSATSFGALLPAAPGAWATALLDRLTPFTLWGLLLWIVGLRETLRTGWARAAGTAVPVWCVLLVGSAAVDVIGRGLAGDAAGLG